MVNHLFLWAIYTMAMLVITRLGISNRFETDFAALDLWTMMDDVFLD